MRSIEKNTTHMHMRQLQTISLQSIQTRAYNGLTIVTKVLGLYYIHGGNTTTVMVVDYKN